MLLGVWKHRGVRMLGRVELRHLLRRQLLQQRVNLEDQDMKRLLLVTVSLGFLLAVPVNAGEMVTLVSLEVEIPSENTSLRAQTPVGEAVQVVFGEEEQLMLLTPYLEREGVGVDVHTGKEGTKADQAAFVERLTLAVGQSTSLTVGKAEVSIKVAKVEELEDTESEPR
jgi:hypothetical protein